MHRQGFGAASGQRAHYRQQEHRPGETRSPFVTSGVRLGTPAVTTRGMGAAEMQVIADCIADCIWHYEEKKDEISERVLRLTREFPLYQ